MKPTQRPIHRGLTCSMALVSEAVALVSEDEKPWYFYSGCSRHMTGAHKNLRDIKPLKGGRVTFGDGSQGAIKSKGKTVESRPPLKDVFFVKGLKANLISISQLCDEGLMVQFTSRDCKAVNVENRVMLHGVRSANNCYVWQMVHQCFVAHDETSLWHQRIGHMNMRHMTNIIKKGAVRGIPQLEETEKTVCGPCNQGKQVKVQHKMIQDIQ